MEVFTSSSSISKDPATRFSGAVNGVVGSTNTSASSEGAAIVGQQSSSSSGHNPPYGNYNYHINCSYNNYNQMPPPPPHQYAGHGAYMQQQQQHYYNYIPTLPPAPPSKYINRRIATYYAPLNNYINNNGAREYSPYPPPPPPPPSLMLLTSLREKIAKQIDYYFCDDNLAKDEYLKRRMDEEGWVPITLIAGFRRISELNLDTKFVLDSLIYSANVEVKGDKVRRRGNWKKWLISPPKQQESQIQAITKV